MESLLSEHIKRHKGASAQTLKKYVDAIRQNFLMGKVVSSDGQIFISDYAVTMTDLLLAARVSSQKGSGHQEEETVSLGVSTHQESTEISATPATLVKVPDNEVQEINLNRLVKKPSYFDGISPLPREWIEEYQDAVEDNSWNDATAIFYFKHFLIKDANVWFKMAVRPKIKSNWVWHDLYQLFAANYLGRAEEDRVRALLRNLVMKPEDRVSNFIPVVQQYLKILHPDMQERDVVRSISEKLKPMYATTIVDKDPATIDDLRDICRKVEAAQDLIKSSERRVNKNSNQSYLNRGNNPTGSQVKPATPVVANDSRPPVFGEFRPRRACHRCGQTNHIVRFCWASRHVDGTILDPATRSTERPAIQNLVQEVTPAVEDDQSSDEVTTHVHAIDIAAINKDDRFLKWKVTLNGFKVTSTVDSGALITCINADIVKANKWRIVKSEQQLNGAAGSRLPMIGAVVLKVGIRIADVTKFKKHRLMVVEDLSSSVLLGIDLLRAFKIVVDVPRNELVFSITPSTGMRLSETTTIPPRSRTIVSTNVAAVGCVMTVRHELPNTIVAANSVDVVRDGVVRVMLLNTTNSEVVLNEGVQVASFEEIEEKELEEKVVTKDSCSLQLENSLEVVRIGPNLTESQRADLAKLLNTYSAAFSLHGEVGCADTVKHKIELIEGAKPVIESLRRRAPAHVDETRRQVEKMLKEGIISESSSPWASPYLVVKKKTGDFRVCIDFRKVNDLTKKNAYPLPNIESCLETLAGKKFFSQFDFCSGYWQVAMDESSKEVTAFRTEDGLFEWNRMPFGLSNAPATFQKLMNTLLAGVKGLELQVYLDDVCLATETWEEHVEMLEKFFKLVINANLKLKASKCLLGDKELLFLGHLISEEGVRQDPSKLRAIKDLPRPRNVKEVRQALGLFSYYRKFVPKMAEIAAPLQELTRKEVNFLWEEKHERAFRTLIDKLLENATLTRYNEHDEVMIKTDASRLGIAGILLQKQNDVWKIVTCCSRSLSKSEFNYGVTDLEGLAVVFTLEKFRPYLLGRKFKLLTDHCSLCVLRSRTPTSSRLHRWACILREFDFDVVYTKGTLHNDVDCLSRAPVNNEVDDFLDQRIMFISVPLNIEEWTEAYLDDDEAENFIRKAIDNLEGFELKDELVYKNDRLFVPKSKRNAFLKEAHSTGRGGHGGVHVTKAKLGDCWWPSLNEDVSVYVTGCERCQVRKAKRSLPAGTMHHFVSCEPFHAFAIDTLGPIPESSQGHRYVIVAIDLFTRFVEAKPIPDLKAPHCGEFLTSLFGRYGPPKIVYTDNGPQFLNNVVKDTLKIFGIEHKWSTPDHSQGNAVCERAIQTLQEKLSLNSLTQGELNNWESVLPVTLLALNSSVSKTTGYQPYEMLFGRKCSILDNEISRSVKPHDLHTKLLKDQLAKIHSIAIENQENAQVTSRRYFDARHVAQEFKVGDKVLVRSANKRKGKLENRFVGPYEVKDKSNDIYTLLDLKNVTAKTIQRHTESLKLFREYQFHEPINYVNRFGLWIGLLLILISVVGAEKTLFPQVSPILWKLSSKEVVDREVVIDVNLNFWNPCIAWRDEWTTVPQNKLNAMCGEQFKKWLELIDEFQVLSEINPNSILDNLPRYDLAIQTVTTMVMTQSQIAPHLHAEWDLINQLYAGELNPRNMTRDFIYKTLNYDVSLQGKIYEYVTSWGEVYTVPYETMTMVNALIQANSRLTTILNSVRQRKEIAISDLLELIELDKSDLNICLHCLRNHHTRFEWAVGNKQTLLLSFTVFIPAEDAAVYEADTFDMYKHENDSLSKPTLMTYAGSKLMLFNKTNLCRKGVTTTDSLLLRDKCLIAEYEDPQLDSWAIRNYKDYVPAVKQYLNYNYVYCYPLDIIVDGRVDKCPPHVIKIPRTRSIEVDKIIIGRSTKPMDILDDFSNFTSNMETNLAYAIGFKNGSTSNIEHGIDQVMEDCLGEFFNDIIDKILLTSQQKF